MRNWTSDLQNLCSTMLKKSNFIFLYFCTELKTYHLSNFNVICDTSSKNILNIHSTVKVREMAVETVQLLLESVVWNKVQFLFENLKNTCEEYLWRILLLKHILFFSADFQESIMFFFLCDSSINKLSFLFLSDVFLSVYSISIVRFPPRIWAWWFCWIGNAPSFIPPLLKWI